MQLLSNYRPDQVNVLKKKNFLKWNAHVELYETGLPSFNAMLLPFVLDEAVLRESILFFQQHESANRNLIRFDHPSLAPDYPACGRPAVKIDDLVSAAVQGVSKGWYPLIAGIFDRVKLCLTANILFLDESHIVMEFLGPGFDTADLQKNTALPVCRVQSKEIAPNILCFIDEDGHLNHHALSRIRHYVDVFTDFSDKTNISNRANRVSFLGSFFSLPLEKAEEHLNAGMQGKQFHLTWDQIELLYGYAASYAWCCKEKGVSYKHHALGANLDEKSQWVFVNQYKPDRFR